MVAVGVREVHRDAVGRLHRRRVLELYTARLELLEVFATIVRQEYPVVAAAVSLRRCMMRTSFI